MKTSTQALEVFVLVMAISTGVCGAATVDAWALPEGGAIRPDRRDGWKSCGTGADPAGGIALENDRLLLFARPGDDSAVLRTKTKDGATCVRLALFPAGKFTKVRLARLDEAAGALALSNGSAAAELSLGAGQAFVGVHPGKGASNVAVHADAKYALLPDFFADDVIYDPAKYASSVLPIPADNFVLQLAGGGNAIVMCIWPGNLEGVKSSAKETAAQPPKTDDRDPNVELILSGEAEARRVAACRIEFLGRPVFVGVIEHKGLWRDEDVRSWAGYTPTAVEWKRPFDAKWRADFVVAEGRKTDDWHTRSQSFPFFGPVKDPKDKWWGRGDEDNPAIWQEALNFFTAPAWFKNDETRLCLYADLAERRNAENQTKAARQGNPNAPEVRPPNIYERVLIYPLDRVRGMPPDLLTPVDLMRGTLGQGPCEYILDLEGVKPRPAGGTRPLIGGATCGIWDSHIFPIVSRNIKNLKEGEKLDDKTRQHLIVALEDIIGFVHAVHDRLREYKAWGIETAAFIESEAKRDAALKALADRLAPHVAALNRDVGRLQFEGKGTEGGWAEHVKQLIQEVQADNYANVASVAGIRTLGGYQDQMVARCRRCVKGLRQEASLADVSDPAAHKFASEVRDRCQAILRRKHGKEGL